MHTQLSTSNRILGHVTGNSDSHELARAFLSTATEGEVSDLVEYMVRGARDQVKADLIEGIVYSSATATDSDAEDALVVLVVAAAKAHPAIAPSGLMDAIMKDGL